MAKPTIKSQLECRELKDSSAGSSWTKTETWRGCVLPFFNIVLELSPNSTGLNKGDPDTICDIRAYTICVIIF